MQKLRIFFDVFWKSISDPVYYSDILKSKFSLSLKYLTFLLFLFALVTTGKIVRVVDPLYKNLPMYIADAKMKIPALYPKDLVISIHNGVLSTTAKEPYVIDLPGWKPDAKTNIDHVITIDTKANAEDFPNYRTLILITKKAVFYQENNFYKFIPLANFTGDFTIDNNQYQFYVSKILPYTDFIPTYAKSVYIVGIILLPIFLTYGSLIGKLFYLLIMSFGSVLLARIIHVQFTYTQVYRFGMHAVTIPMIMTLILGAFYVEVPMLFTLVFFIWMTVILTRFRKK